MLLLFFQILFKNLSFFVHGLRLLTPAAAIWLFSLWFLAVAMAVLEGLTWARMLMVFLPVAYEWVGVMFGCIWGTAIFIIDASFATLDTTAKKKDLAFAENADGSVPRGFARWTGNSLLMGTLIRVCIITFSMVLSGPFLADSLDERQVTREIAKENEQTIAAGLIRAEEKEHQRVRALQERLQRLRDDHKQEVSRGGRGPIAQAIEVSIVALEQEIARAEADGAARLARLRGLRGDEISTQLGVQLIPDNAESRAKIRRQLHNEPAADMLFGLPASHVVASSLFLLLFLMMLALKYFQPMAAKIYFNDPLQEEYGYYMRGGFARLRTNILPEADRHNGPAPMGAWRFHTWYYTVYRVAMDAIRADEEMRTCEAEAKERWRAIEAANDEVVRVQGELGRARHHAADIDRQLDRNRRDARFVRAVPLVAEQNADQEKAHRLHREVDVCMSERDVVERELAEVSAKVDLIRYREGVLGGAPAPSAVENSPVYAQAERSRLELRCRKDGLELQLKTLADDAAATAERIAARKREIDAVEPTSDLPSGGSLADTSRIDGNHDVLLREKAEAQLRLDSLETELRRIQQRMRELESRDTRKPPSPNGDSDLDHDHDRQPVRPSRGPKRDGGYAPLH